MNSVRHTFLAISAVIIASCRMSPPSVIWEEGLPAGNQAVHSIVICDASGLGPDWEIWFSQMPDEISVLDGSGAGIERIMANTYRIYPCSGQDCDSIFIRYRTSPLKRNSWAPEGFVLRNAKGQKELTVSYRFITPEETLPAKRWRKPDFGEDGNPFGYRGFMLDVARSFTPAKEVIRLLDTLACYKVNYLHLHITDDEGWRFEVKGLPELTSVGAFHALPVRGTDGRWCDIDALQPSYDGCADRTDGHSLANGYYSRKDFVRILRHAWRKGIRVIPEIDTPGHSRAAIKAMEAYERRTGDASMRLSAKDDPSVYLSAQWYSDNILDVSAESVYKFLFRIWDEIIGIYSEAGVELPAIHIGGDEVPDGVWSWDDDPKALRCGFIRRMAEFARSRGVRLAGWQELVQDIDEDTFALLQPVLFGVNCWTDVSEEMLAGMAELGVPVIISDARYTYADQAYSPAKTETGHSWAAFTDENKTYGFKIPRTDNILGIQVQMFTETVRKTSDIYYDVFPKMLGIFDLAWNPGSQVQENQSYVIPFDGSRELPGSVQVRAQ